VVIYHPVVQGETTMVTSLRDSNVETKNLVGTFAECLIDAEEGDVVGLFQELKRVPNDDVLSYDGEYLFAVVLVAMPDKLKILSRFYRGEPEWIEPLEGSSVETVAGTTILVDDTHITLIDQDGKKIPCDKIGTCILLKNRLPELPAMYQFNYM